MPVTFFIPETITVHLGAPDDTSAQNVTVPFIDYIKNVASSEIYPTWPESAIRANMYAQITYALNRIFTQYYRSRGYDFDITNTTQLDQAYVHNRDIFENISQIADNIFNDYLVRPGTLNPIFARYCNGTTSTCPGGLSQWGTVSLAEQGLTPYEILTNYYGENLNIVMDAPIANLPESYPGTPLRIGSSGADVNSIQLNLNRIAQNYPAIPKITYPDGIFDIETEEAVREFQRIFNLTPDGVVGKATWYKIIYLYNTVKRLSDLDAEGISLENVSRNFKTQLSQGSMGEDVRLIQYFLSLIAEFNDYIPAPAIDGVFGQGTVESVRAFQASVNLPQNGIVDETTWNALLNQYTSTVAGLPPDFRGGGAAIFPGRSLSRGMSGEDVRLLQTYLSRIAMADTTIPPVQVNGFFDPATEAAVVAFQEQNGIPPRGVVGLNTWNAIAEKYNSLI